MLNGTLTLHDIQDVEAFCTTILDKRGLHDHPDHDDILAYLIATTWELSTTYEPHLASFSTYAGTALRNRLTDRARSTGRTIWKFRNRTYTRTLPTIVPLDDATREAHTTPSRDPAADRDTDHLVRLLRERSSSEAWDHDLNRQTLPRRAA